MEIVGNTEQVKTNFAWLVPWPHNSHKKKGDPVIYIDTTISFDTQQFL